MTRQETSHHNNPNGGTARHLLTSRVPIIAHDEVVASARALLQEHRFEALEVIIVTDDHGRYQGIVELGALMAADAEAPIASLVDRQWPTVSPETDQEHAALIAGRAGVATLPVVSADGRPLGLIAPARLLATLAEEHLEDVHRLVGMLRASNGVRHGFEDPPVKRAGLRLPWLLVGLAMSTAGTALMAGFEGALRNNLAIAFFIPAIVYLADAIGTQTEAVAVRSLAFGQRPLLGILLPELLTGALIGLVLGAIAVLGVLLVFADGRLAAGVGISLFAAGSLASAIGLLLPWVLSGFGIDPAFGSGPVATIIQDVLTLAVYFLVMSVLLG